MIWITHLLTTAANAAEVHIFVVDGKAVQSLNTYQVRDKVIDPPAFFAPEVPVEAGVRVVVDRPLSMVTGMIRPQASRACRALYTVVFEKAGLSSSTARYTLSTSGWVRCSHRYLYTAMRWGVALNPRSLKICTISAVSVRITSLYVVIIIYL